MAYASSADKALEYLSARVLNEEWVKEHDDIAYYFKAPMAFLEAGCVEQAQKVLDTAAAYIERGGLDSANAAYSSQYPHYPWMWMCWAATRLNRDEIARDCFAKLYAYVHPATSSGLVVAPFSDNGKPFEADFFATAEVVKVACLVGQAQLASQSADMLLKVIESNSQNMRNGRFQLRWSGACIEDVILVSGDDALHCVLQQKPEQMYFMMAFPAMVLLEIANSSERVAADRYNAGALQLLEYLKKCVGVFESPMAHKVGRAAAMANDNDAAIKVANFLLSLQQSLGNFQHDSEAMDSVDQTAEIAVWLRQISMELHEK